MPLNPALYVSPSYQRTSLSIPPPIGQLSAQALTLNRLALVVKIRLASHSPAVTPVSNLPGGALITASAIMELCSASARIGASKLGLVKKTKDQRSNFACSFGGGLDVTQSESFPRGGRTRGGAYTTRWMLERMIPPLKTLRASPILHMA